MYRKHTNPPYMATLYFFVKCHILEHVAIAVVIVLVTVPVVVIIVMTLSGKWDKCIFRSCHTTIWQKAATNLEMKKKKKTLREETNKENTEEKKLVQIHILAS